MLGFWSMPWKMGWKYAIKMEGIFGMVNVGCWNFGHKEGWPHPSPFLIHIQVPPFSSLIYICPNSLFKFCPEFICQEKLKICCCKACQHLFRLRLHACPQDLCLREGVKNHLPPRQHCRLSICCRCWVDKYLDRSQSLFYFVLDYSSTTQPPKLLQIPFIV